jgi:hypothetical protein
MFLSAFSWFFASQSYTEQRALVRARGEKGALGLTLAVSPVPRRSDERCERGEVM